VDLRMIKALADLPGDRGMEAVDRFSGSSLETVRSKTGFMVRAPLASLLCTPSGTRARGRPAPLLILHLSTKT